ncbi:MAG: ABC transporter permease [Gemmatimonadaceae bacterium]|nr:ABC transporter permease [Gemmatimonadaceae bacterium]
MRALNRKLLRDVWKHRGQMLSIAAVVSVGIMTVLTMRGAYESLSSSQAQYYRDTRFPDVWVRLERAPESLRGRIAAIPGVSAVNTRVTLVATLDVPSVDVPALGYFVSVTDDRGATLSDLHLSAGRFVSPRRRDEVVVSDKFAIANAFVPGDTLRAVINGRQRDLQIVGTAISPEYTYAVPPGAIYPDDQRFGIVWMHRDALGPAYDMAGAFNEVVLTLSPRADTARVVAQLDRLLEPYGGLGAYTRMDQPSHFILAGELNQVRSMGTMIPAVFLTVAAFLLNIVLGRMIATQRTELAVLKAFGYSDLEVGRHYLQFALVAVLLGALIGIAMGSWLGQSMVGLYGEFFTFPTLRYEFSWILAVLAVGVSALAAAAGALGAVRRAVALPPAEAMRPEPPTSFRPGVFERLGLGRLLPVAGRLILRNVERTPLRSVASAIGVGFSVAILVIGLFMFDGVQYMMDLQFQVAQREDLALTFNRPVSSAVRYQLQHLRGVTRVEPFRMVPVRLRSGHRKRETGITGLEQHSRLRRIVTAGGGTQPVPLEGLMVSKFLADQLGLSVGDPVIVEVLEGTRRTVSVPITGVVEDFLGVMAYMEMGALHRLARGGRVVSGAYLTVDPAQRAALNAYLKELPAVASVASPGQLLASFEKQLADGLFIGVFFLLGFSGVIAVAVVYNGARVALSERGRELASLRVLGFSRREVAVLLLGEQGLTTLAGIPVGWALGYGLAALVSAGLQTETYRIPLVVSSRTFALAATITVLAAVVSGLVVRRRLDRMDLIEVLKTRE